MRTSGRKRPRHARHRHGRVLLLLPPAKVMVVYGLVLLGFSHSWGFGSVQSGVATASFLSGLQTPTDNNLVCRITMEDTLYASNDKATADTTATTAATIRPKMYSEEKISCVPQLIANDGNIDDGYEDYDLFAVDLPSHITMTATTSTTAEAQALPPNYMAAMRRGQLFVSITNARVDRQQGAVITSQTSVFTVLEHQQSTSSSSSSSSSSTTIAHRPGRRLQKAYTDAMGVRRYAIVRVSTSDRAPRHSVAELRSAFVNSVAGTEWQYAACSGGKLDFQLHDVYDVHLPGSVASYNNKGRDVRDAATHKLMEQLGLTQHSFPHVDNMLFCIPPGTGNWVANAGTGHWMSQFNDGWCTSLTAAGEFSI